MVRRPLWSEASWHAFAAAAATGTDYVVVLSLVAWGGHAPAFATVLGCLVGGALNFWLNRAITFRRHDALAAQATRYAFVSASSAGLNGLGMALLAPRLDHRVAWWLVRGVVWLAWNFPLQRGYVFRTPAAAVVQAARRGEHRRRPRRRRGRRG